MSESKTIRRSAIERESAFRFPDGDGQPRPAILHRPDSVSGLGVLVVVGGPQYRVGSHRQFVLLARALADAGVPVMRFDYRGMGDAAGQLTDFTGIDDEIRAAIDAFRDRVEGMQQVVLWGLCDAASAALFYGWRDPRVAGLVLLNPWIRTEAGQARTYVRRYYLARLASRDFWRKARSGRLELLESLRSLARNVLLGWRRRRDDSDEAESRSLPGRMASGLEHFDGPVLFILSGGDLTAGEFRDTVSASPRWQELMNRPRIRVETLPEADHTFSRRQWRDDVAQRTLAWLESL